MTTARTAMHYLVMAAFICATSQSAIAATTVKPATAAASIKAPAPAPVKAPVKPKPKTCLEVYNTAGPRATTLASQAKVVNASATPAPTLSTQDLKNASVQAALRATLLKVALLALSKLPEGKACDAIIAKIDAKFSRS
jgi:hypothetical protein